MEKLIKIDNYYNKDVLIEAKEFIKEGKLVLFPTETVYGIGADGLNSEAVKKIFIAKNRAQDNPLIMHVSNMEMINRIVKSINPIEKELINRFFPGPLTIIFPKKEIVPNEVTCNLETVGVRMPENAIAQDLIELSNTPIAAPSANISGKPSGTNIEDIFDELKDSVDCIIDAGDAKIGIESTVVRVIDGVINILRPGKITVEDLEKVAPVKIANHVLEAYKSNDIVTSPGVKYRHYAPKTKCILVYSLDKDKMINYMKKHENSETLIITNEENVKCFNNAVSYGKSLDDISHNIFKLLRSVDRKNMKLIIIEGVSKEGLGLGIMNRLLRACSYNYYEL